MKFNFFGELDCQCMDEMIRFLFACKEEKSDPVMLINSFGGLAAGAELVYEFLLDTKLHFTTIAIGNVASAAAAIFALGDRRIVLPGTEFLIHNSRHEWDNAVMQKHDYKVELARLEACDERMMKMYYKTGITKEIFEEHCNNGRDWILTPDEIEKYRISTEDYKGWTKYN